MEKLIFWIVPLILLAIGFKRPLLSAWKDFVCAAFALYIGVWAAPLWWGLLDFLPPALVPYRNAMAIAVDFVVLFSVLCIGAKGLCPDGYEGVVFPSVPERIFSALAGFGTGICLMTFLMVLCCASPLRLMTRNDGNGFEDMAALAMLRITRIADGMTFCRPEQPRAEALNRFWYRRPPETPEAGEDAKTAQDKTAQDKSAPVKADAPPAPVKPEAPAAAAPAATTAAPAAAPAEPDKTAASSASAPERPFWAQNDEIAGGAAEKPELPAPAPEPPREGGSAGSDRENTPRPAASDTTGRPQPEPLPTRPAEVPDHADAAPEASPAADGRMFAEQNGNAAPGVYGSLIKRIFIFKFIPDDVI